MQKVVFEDNQNESGAARDQNLDTRNFNQEPQHEVIDKRAENANDNISPKVFEEKGGWRFMHFPQSGHVLLRPQKDLEISCEMEK